MSRFSIVIPTWNNLPYLKLCIKSLQENSHFSNQIIVFVNEGKDGTAEWLKSQNIDFLQSDQNVGICVAMNACRSLVRSKYLVYMNDDMYACPNWDLELYQEIEKVGHELFMFSATLIEPRPTGNPSYVAVIKDFGDSLESFQERKLLENYRGLHKTDWSGASWPPSVVSLEVWDKVGGYSIEFSPGMYSDPDFSMKLWKLGVRLFKGVGASKVYHFGSKSTKRMRKNMGSDTFLMKWGITARTFYREYLQMGRPFAGSLNVPEINSGLAIKNRLKRMFKALSR